jgi:hemolysin activation/secretion protein
MMLGCNLPILYPFKQWLVRPRALPPHRYRRLGPFRAVMSTSFLTLHRAIGAVCLCFLLASGTVLAAAIPGVGALPGDEFKAPIPPNMRRFLAKPEPEAPAQKGADDARIEVNAIVLDGVVDRPNYNILLDELNALVEQKRLALIAAQKMSQGAEKEGQPSPQQDKQARDKLLNQIETLAKDKESESTLDELEQTIQRYRAKPEPGNMLTLQQLQEIAALVAQYYRDRGFILVRAVIPPQTIKDGRVHIRVLEGILGNVTIEKNRNYDREQMLRPFRDILGQPVTKDSIEEALLLLNDYPGLETFAVFRPGLHPGETDLLVSVLEEASANTNVHLDNYGSEYTGEYRGRLDIQWNNPSNSIDILRASLSKTYSPNNGTFSSLYYERHAFGPKNLFGIGASQNKYSLGSILEPFGISGNTILSQVYWRRAFHRSRLFNSYALLQFSRKSAKLDVTEGEDRADELSVFSVESGFDWASSTRRHMANARIQYSQGAEGLFGAMAATNDPAQTSTSRRGGSGFYAGGKFSKLNIDYDHWYNISSKHMLHVAFRSQFSEDLLTSLEQMAIGGPNSVRAYPTAAFLRDKAVSTSVEWLMQAPGFSQWKAFGNKTWGELLQVSLFVDYAKGWLNDPLASDREVVSLSGVGAGLRFNYEDFSARFEFASPVGDEPPGNDRNPQYFFEMNFGF